MDRPLTTIDAETHVRRIQDEVAKLDPAALVRWDNEACKRGTPSLVPRRLRAAWDDLEWLGRISEAGGRMP